MDNTDTQFEEVLIDGQMVIIPTPEAWQEIARNPIFLGVPAYSGHLKELVTDLIDFVSKHKEQFRLGMFRIKVMDCWSVRPFLLLDGCLHRVQIEHVACDQCSWRVTIANPTDVTLYFGTPNRWDALAKAFELPRVGCPNCNAPLSRVAIWADPEKSWVAPKRWDVDNA